MAETEKVIKTRIKTKYDNVTNWETVGDVIIPYKGEIILVEYTDEDGNILNVRAKIGDNVRTFNQLPFSDEVIRNLITDNQLDISTLQEDLSNYYTKTEIDSKISSVYKYKGSVASYDALPTTAEVGDVYNIENASGSTKTLTVARVDNIMSDYGEDEALFTINVEIGIVNSNGVVDFYDSDLNLVKSNVTVNNQMDEYNFSLFDWTSVLTQEQLNSIKYVQLAGQSSSSDALGEAVTVGILINAGDNVAWTGTEWDKLAGTIDTSSFATRSNTLSGYGITDAYTKTEVDDLISSAGGGGSVVDTDALTYKGSKYNITYLPKTGNSVGDVWNLIGKTTITKNVYVAQINSCEYANSIENTIISTNALPVSSGGVNIYDTSMKYICYADIIDNQELWYQGEMEGWQTFQTGEYYFVLENATYNDTEIPIYTLGENAKVVWTGDEWQPFTGDMSSFATKEEVSGLVSIREATFEEIDAALGAMEAS